MIGLLAQFIGLAGVIVVAGTFLTRSADVIGERTALGRTLAGMVLLAAATSLPELAVNCSAAAIGAPDIAVGSSLGSSLFNLLILAVLDRTSRRRGQLFSPAAGAHAISATMSVILTALVLLGIVTQRALAAAPSRAPWSLAGIDPWTIVIVLAYVLLLRLVFFDQRERSGEAAGESVLEASGPGMSLVRAVVIFGGATAIIFLSAPRLSHVADALAVRTGLGESFVGTTMVALCTSLPELVTTAAAVRMGAFDLAVGNIVGSNSFNMMVLFPVDFFQPGPLLATVSSVHAVTAACVIVVTSVMTTGLLYRSSRRGGLLAPNSTVAILLILASLALVYTLK